MPYQKDYVDPKTCSRHASKIQITEDGSCRKKYKTRCEYQCACKKLQDKSGQGDQRCYIQHPVQACKKSNSACYTHSHIKDI